MQKITNRGYHKRKKSREHRRKALIRDITIKIFPELKSQVLFFRGPSLDIS